MITKLVRHGDDWALVIDQAVLDRLQIDSETPLQISTDGQTLIVSPVTDAARNEQFCQALVDVNQQYERALKKLAE